MVREPASFLWDVQFAGRHVLQFVHGADFGRYCNDLLLRSAVERQLQNMGEALSQLAPVIVWNAIQHDLPVLLTTVDAVLGRLGPPPTE